MKIQRHIIILFIAALIVIARFATHSYQNYKTNLQTSSWINHTNTVIKTVESLYNTATVLESSSRGYIITGQPSFKASFRNDSSLIKDQLQALRVLTSDNPVEQNNIDSLNMLLNKEVAHCYRLMTLRDSSAILATQQLSLGNGVLLMTDIKSVVDSMLREENKLLEWRIPANKKTLKQALRLSFLGGAVSLIFLVLFLYLINRDIQRRKRAESDLKASEIKYRKLIEDAGAVMFTSDIQGCFTFISNRVLELTGYQKEELIGKLFAVLVAPEEVERIRLFYQEQLKNRTPETTTEFPIVTRDGEKKWIEQTGVILYDDENHIKGLQCMVKDIDEKKRMQVQLEESEYYRRENQYRLESILANANSMIYMKDLQGKYLLINRKFETTFNHSAADIIGKTDYDFNKKEDADRYSEADQKVIESQKPFKTEEALIQPDGIRHYMIVKFPLFNTDNKLYGLCGIATDISDRVRYEHELVEARKIAENAEKLQEQFLANMSHDIRTPLNGIIGMTGLLHSTELNAEQHEFTEAIKQSADTLLVLINDILDLSKIKAGMLNIECIPFRLADLISRATYTLRQKAAEKEVRFDVSIDPGIPAVLKGDPYRLSQILVNLIGNAVKFTDEGGISLSVEKESLEGENIRVCFSVKDSGIGIPAEKLDAVFENFTQSSSDVARKYGGSGLGLAIVKQLVQLQGGDIHVESVLNKGSRFYFTIPYIISNDDEKQLSQKKEEENVTPSAELKGYRLLVAEDDSINQKMVNAILKKAGVQADMVSNGREMIDYLESGNHYDLILSDIHMPEMDGYEAAVIIRKKLNLNIPILAMTATVMQDEKENCLYAGMNDFISKPFTLQELLKKIAKYVPKPEQRPLADQDKAANDTKPMPLYDLSYLDEMGDKEYSKEVLQMFLETTPAALEDIKNAITIKNWKEVYQKAHRLKSSTGLLKMQSLFESLAMMEANAKEQTGLNEMPVLAQKIQSLYNTICPLMEEEIKRLS